MKDNGEISNLRKKLESSRDSGRQSSIESRLYGSLDDADSGEERADAPKPKVQDFSTLKKEPEEKAEKKDGPRILADFTKESGGEPRDEASADRSAEEEAVSAEPEEGGPRILADYTKAAAEVLPDEGQDDEPAVKEEPHAEEASGGDPVKKPANRKKEKKTKRYTRFTALKENLALIPKRILIPVLVFTLMFGALLWYVFTDASDLKEISISGNEIISAEEIESRLGFEPGDKMFSISTDRAVENITLLPIIVEATVERDWWNGVDVNIREYRAVGYVENEGGYNPLLENARILRGYQVTPSSGPLVHHFEGEEMDQLVDNLNDIEPEILAGISEIYYRPSENSMTRIHIFMNDGQELVADYRDFGEKMNHYIGMKEEIGADSEGIIDIEIGSSFLPYDSAEAREIKEGIYNVPETGGYAQDINASMNRVKEVLNEFENFEDE